MELQVPAFVLYGVFTLVLGWLLHFIYQWTNPACNGQLPPGSMGLPIVGETLQLMKSSPSLDIPDFYKLRLKRYGSLFKTSLMGKPVVVSMDAEFNRFVFRNNDKLFRLWCPDTMNSIIGKNTLAQGYGSVHKYIRSFSGPFYAPKNLEEAFVSGIESIITESLRTWATKPNIEVNEALADSPVRISPSTGPWSIKLLEQAAEGKAQKGVLDSDVRRSDQTKRQLNGFRKNCPNNSCLGCSLDPPTLSPSVIKNLGTEFCKVDPAKMKESVMLKKKKVLPPVEKKKVKKNNPKDTDDADAAKQAKKKTKK